jgi:hypothetical protein
VLKQFPAVSKRHPICAVLFVLGGLLVGFGFYVLLTLAHMLTGMSAPGIPQQGPSIMPVIVLFETYFMGGVVASLLTQVGIRRKLAIGSHVALLSVGFYLTCNGVSIMNVITGCVFVTCIVYANCWLIMTRWSFGGPPDQQ